MFLYSKNKQKVMHKKNNYLLCSFQFIVEPRKRNILCIYIQRKTFVLYNKHVPQKLKLKHFIKQFCYIKI